MNCDAEPSQVSDRVPGRPTTIAERPRTNVGRRERVASIVVGSALFVRGLRRRVRVGAHDDENCFRVPDKLDDEQALFASDAWTQGYMGADFCDIEDGDTVAVWGCDGVGLMAQQSAKLMGAECVVGIDRSPERLRLASDEAGAETIDYTDVDSVVDTLDRLTGGRGPDACIDAVGMEAHGTGVGHAYDRAKQQLKLHTDRGEALREAIIACRKGGTLLILGVYGLMDNFPLEIVMNKGLTVRTAQQHGQRYVPQLLEHVEEGEMDPSYLATHEFNLEDAPKGYEIFKHKEDGCVRPVFTPEFDESGLEFT